MGLTKKEGSDVFMRPGPFSFLDNFLIWNKLHHFFHPATECPANGVNNAHCDIFIMSHLRERSTAESNHFHKLQLANVTLNERMPKRFE